MQPAPRVDRSISVSRLNELLFTGAAVVGATAIAVNPLAPNITADLWQGATVEVQHHEVQLASAIGDVVGAYTGVLTGALTNLQTLGDGAAVAIPQLLEAVGGSMASSADLLQTGLAGAAASVQNAMYGGWWGADDGYVFGLFGGSVTHNGVTKTGSTLQLTLQALSQGQLFNAFGYIEPWALELIDHTMKPLLSPFLNTARAGATPSTTIPGEILQIATNVANTFLSYSQLKAVSKTVMAPALNVVFATLEGLDNVGAHVASANIVGAVTDILKMPADVAGALLNGYTLQNPDYNPTGAAFTGLLNKGSLLDLVLVTWPKQLATAINAAAPAKAAVAATSVASVDSAASIESSDSATTPAADTASPKAVTAETPRVTKIATGSKTASAKRHSSGNGRGAAGSAPKSDTGKGRSARSHSEASHANAS